MENGEEATCRDCGEWYPKEYLTNGFCHICFIDNLPEELASNEALKQ